MNFPIEDYRNDVGGIRTKPGKGKGVGKSKGKNGRRKDGQRGTRFMNNKDRIADCYKCPDGQKHCGRPGCKYYPCVKQMQKAAALEDPWNEGTQDESGLRIPYSAAGPTVTAYPEMVGGVAEDEPIYPEVPEEAPASSTDAG